ncbi:toll-like receptor 4 [Alosa sapidissima]|uniref:toll-like receptor 4 n=1 Tax=Alosa sapidissima TaxID=34773 RepID=UPI001C089844|nr:toll-like receptor 4 [Alosa sapidissima]
MAALTVYRCALLDFIILCTAKIIKDPGDCLEVIPSLQYSCFRRNLSYIPTSIPPSTQHLDFSFNYLTTLQRHMFPRLPLLQHLDLTRCHIQNIDNEAFFNVRNLSVLILTGNPLKHFGKNSINVLEKIHKLVLVDIGLLSLDSLNLQSLTSLKELKVGTNRLFSLALPSYAVSFKEFTLLDLHKNNISTIRAVDTSVLRQMSSNLTLILSSNPISFIETGAFNGLSLREINLLDTISSTTAREALGGLSGLKVKKLKIGHFLAMGKIQMNSDSLTSLCFIKFQEIYFCQSFFFELPSHIVLCMINSTKISLRYVGINTWEHSYFPNLKEIVVVEGHMDSLPNLLLSHQHKLKKLVINDNEYSSILKSFADLPSLEYIDLSHNNLIMSCCNAEFIGVPKLRYLNLSENARVTIRTLGLFNYSSLEILDLHGTEVEVADNWVIMHNLRNLKFFDLSYTQFTFDGNAIFYGLSSLKELKMAGNSIEKDIFGKLFSNLSTLEVLDISNCGLKDISFTSFQDLHNLRHLTLSGNKLTTVDFLTCPCLSKLTSIHVDNNHIASISSNVLQNLPANLLVVDLSFNPIECSCSQTEFISWIINHQSVLKDPQLMSCKSSEMNSRVINFDPTHCVHRNRVIIISSLFAAVIVLLLSALLYKYQFYIHYCFILLRGYRMSRQQECSYDAFVIYSSKDEAWVLDELVENLEKGHPPIQFCLHERDFQAGKSITSNIVDEGIMGSRKVIVVVSQHFLDSSWCQFEFELAQSWLVLRRNASIIIIILEDVEDKKIKRLFRLHKYLKKNTYLKWKGNALSNIRFWARLRKAIIAMQTNENVEIQITNAY